MGLLVEKIENGTVIDHICAGRGLLVLRLLSIDQGYSGKVAFVMNVPSKSMLKKDIVKIADLYIDEKTANKIALFAPEATFNLIKDGTVTEKKKVELPQKLLGIARCPNPVCITNNEPRASLETEFIKTKEGALRCAYCEKTFSIEEMQI